MTKACQDSLNSKMLNITSKLNHPLNYFSMNTPTNDEPSSSKPKGFTEAFYLLLHLVND